MTRSTCRNSDGVQIEAAEMGGRLRRVKPARHGAFQHLRLLVNLLEHEMLVLALVRVGGFPVESDGSRALTCWLSSVENFPVFGSEHAHLMIAQIDHALRVANQGARVAGQENLTIADAQDERTAQAGSDHQARETRADDGQPIGAFQMGKAFATASTKSSLR